MKLRHKAILVCALLMVLHLRAQATDLDRYRISIDFSGTTDPDALVRQLLSVCRCRQEPYAELGFEGIVITATPAAAQILARDPRVLRMDAIGFEESITEDANVPVAPTESRLPAFVAPEAASASVPRVPETLTTASWDVAYEYDHSGNIKKIGADEFTYDALGRIRRGDAAGKRQEYAYDRYGNLVNIKTTGKSDVVLVPVPSSNRLTNNQGNALGTYDPSGRMLSSGGSTFQYDALDMVTESYVGIERKIHLYSPTDERLASLTVDSNGAELRSDWTIRDLSARVLRRYTRTPGNQWTWREDYVYADDRLLASEVDTPEGTLRYHLDHLGTPRWITGNGGVKVAEHHYYPFGEEATSPLQDAEKKKFTGHERDASSLDYMHARYYNPEWGRFLSVDPSRESVNPAQPQSWNRYAYVLNNPMGLVDPTGMDAEITCDADNNCEVEVWAEIVAESDDAEQAAAEAFKRGAEQYWNTLVWVEGPVNQVTFNVQLTVVSSPSGGMDTLTVEQGANRAAVNMNFGITASGQLVNTPDTGTIYTVDTSGNCSGLQGVGAHEVGHLLGLPDGYRPGERVPQNSSPNADLMRHAESTNRPLNLPFLFDAANFNVTVRDRR